MIDALFLILSVMIIFFATLVVTLPNILHCALSLMAVLLGSAGLYLLLNAEFAALAQVAVYIGGVIVFMVFAIFLTTKIGERATPESLPKRGWALILSALSFSGFYGFYGKNLSSITTDGASDAVNGSMVVIGTRLLGKTAEGFVIPFEVVSVLLLMTVIGAIVIARYEVDNIESKEKEAN